MDLEYDITVEDYIAFSIYLFRNSPAMKRQVKTWQLVTLFLAIGIFLMAIYNYVMLGEHLVLILIIFSIMVVLYMFFYYPRSIENNLRRQIPKMLRESENDDTVGRQKLSITPESMIGKGLKSEVKMLWDSLVKICVTANHIFIYVGAMKAAVIPQTAFPDSAKRDEFLQLVQQYYSNSTGKTLPVISS
jgi:Ca2+/Na+ antiporter